MLRKKRQRDYFDQRWKSIREHLRAYAAHGRPEHLHDLRVAIKKLKMMRLLLALSSGKKDVKAHFRPLKKLFRDAGRIRTAQLHLGLARQYHFADAPFIREQEKIRVDTARKFRSNAGKYEKQIRATKRFYKTHLDDVSSKKLEKIIDGEREALERYYGKIDTAELHESRKRLKNLLYLDGLFSKSLKRRFALDGDYLDHLQETIGKWHDLRLLIDLLLQAKGRGRQVKKLHEEERALLKEVRMLVKDFGKRFNDSKIQ